MFFFFFANFSLAKHGANKQPQYNMQIERNEIIKLKI